MGRHAAAAEGAANVKVTIRATDAAVAAWRAAAAEAGLCLSDWVRLQIASAAQAGPVPADRLPDGVMALVGRRPPRRRSGLGVAVPPPVDPAMVTELVRIGNNVNQLARSRNALGQPPDPVLLVALAGIARQLRAVLRDGLTPAGG